MKEIKELLYSIPTIQVVGAAAGPVGSICSDSRKSRPEALFIATQGLSVDGHNFIDQAIARGAIAIVCERLPLQLHPGVCYVQVESSPKALGIIASNFYDQPSSKLKLIGVTGTNGKTTTATLLFELFRKLGYQVGLLSTIHNRINDCISPTLHTTLFPIELNALLHEMVRSGCAYCFMEVSSHAVSQHRIAGLIFAGGIFTNLSHDHLDFYKTFDSYLKAKKQFFDGLGKTAFALTNVDDKNGRVMLQNTRAHKKSYGLKTIADFKAKVLENHFKGLLLRIDQQEAWFRLIGRFNAYNLLAVYATALLLDQDRSKVLTILSDLGGIEGRFDYFISPAEIIAIVDYAHTPDAVQNVLDTIQDLRKGAEQIITVLGCGGDRDRTKRPLMTQIACRGSNKVFVTSDNPRTEKPEQIIQEMMAGIRAEDRQKIATITNRQEAIQAACRSAKPGDIILVAGKGHEKYQEINGVKYPFDDKEILRDRLNSRS